jgi:hypothetical protein
MRVAVVRAVHRDAGGAAMTTRPTGERAATTTTRPAPAAGLIPPMPRSRPTTPSSRARAATRRIPRSRASRSPR